MVWRNQYPAQWVFIIKRLARAINHLCTQGFCMRFLSWLSTTIFKVLGWKITGERPTAPKFVIIAAPHTSGWDVPIMIMAAYHFKIKLNWFGKASTFRWPLGILTRRLGGIAIDRNQRENKVASMVAKIKAADEFAFALSPEGTRYKTYWKTGFYHIAHQANIPLVCTYINFGTKTAGIGPVVPLTGDIEADMAPIREFYRDIVPKHPERFDRDMPVGRPKE